MKAYIAENDVFAISDVQIQVHEVIVNKIEVSTCAYCVCQVEPLQAKIMRDDILELITVN